MFVWGRASRPPRPSAARQQVKIVALSFAKDILPLFRDDPDVSAMKNYGLDLSSYGGVKARAKEIYATLVDGSMPCDKPWPQEPTARFKQWMDEGMAP